MKGKKQQKENLPDVSVDEREFTDVIRKLANSKPMPFAKRERRKNPETDPRYLPVFPELEKLQKKRKS